MTVKRLESKLRRLFRDYCGAGLRRDTAELTRLWQQIELTQKLLGAL